MSQDEDVEILYTHDQITNFQKEIQAHKNDKQNLSEKLKFQQKETEGFKLKLEETIKLSRDQNIRFTERIQFYEQANMALLKQQQDLNKQFSQIKLLEENLKRKETINERKQSALQETSLKQIEKQKIICEQHTSELQTSLHELKKQSEQLRQLQQKQEELMMENANMKKLNQQVNASLLEALYTNQQSNDRIQELKSQSQATLKQIDMMKNEKNKLQQKRDELENKCLQQVAQVAKLETELLEYKRNRNNLIEIKLLQEMDQKYQSITQELGQLTQQNQSLRNDKESLIAQNEKAQNQTKALSLEFNQLQNELTKATRTNEQLITQIDSLNSLLEVKTQNQTQLSQNIQELNVSLNMMQSNLKQAEAKLMQQQFEINILTQQSTEQINTIDDLKTELNLQIQRTQNISMQKEEIVTQYEKMKKNFDEVEKVKNSQVSEIDRLTSDRDRLAKSLQEKEEKYKQMKQSANDYSIQLQESIELIKLLEDNTANNHNIETYAGDYLALKKENEETKNNLQESLLKNQRLQQEFDIKSDLLVSLEAQINSLKEEVQNLYIQLEQKSSLQKQDEMNYKNVTNELNSQIQKLIERNQIVEGKLRGFESFEDEIFTKADLENQIEILQAQIKRLEEENALMNRVLNFQEEDLLFDMIEIKIQEQKREENGASFVFDKIVQLSERYK